MEILKKLLEIISTIIKRLEEKEEINREEQRIKVELDEKVEKKLKEKNEPKKTSDDNFFGD